jgi:hypothetical protein
VSDATGFPGHLLGRFEGGVDHRRDERVLGGARVDGQPCERGDVVGRDRRADLVEDLVPLAGGDRVPVPEQGVETALELPLHLVEVYVTGVDVLNPGKSGGERRGIRLDQLGVAIGPTRE